MSYGFNYNQPRNYHFNHSNNGMNNQSYYYQPQHYNQSIQNNYYHNDGDRDGNIYQTFSKNNMINKLGNKNISSPALNMNHSTIDKQHSFFGGDGNDSVFRKTMIKNNNDNPLQSSSYNIINNLPYKNKTSGEGIGLYSNRTNVALSPEKKRDYFSDLFNYDPMKENSINARIQSPGSFFGNTMPVNAKQTGYTNGTNKLASPHTNIGTNIQNVITGLSQEIQSKSSEPFLRQIPFIRHNMNGTSTPHNNRVYIEKSSLHQPYYYEKNCSSIIEYAYKEDQNSRFRSYMEDKGKAVDCFKNNVTDGLFCLFDGHGGGEVSKYLQEKFPSYFKDVIPSTNLESTFTSLFNKIDLDIKASNFNNVGATACVVFITKERNNQVVYSANIGDTRSVLITSFTGKRLSYDHRASDKSEHMRIVNEGGIVYAGRVYGQLMLSRAFGDWELKPYGVSNIPYVTRTEITSDDKYLIIGTDGIWDVFTDHEIYQLSLNISNADDYCNLIIKTAQLKGTMDNISCFVIKLH